MQKEKAPLNPNTKGLIIVVSVLLLIVAVLLLFPDLMEKADVSPGTGVLTLDLIPTQNVYLFTRIELETEVPWHIVYAIVRARYQSPYSYEQGIEIANAILDAGAKERGLLFSENVEELVSLYSINKRVASSAIRYGYRLEFANAFLKAGIFPVDKDAVGVLQMQDETYVEENYHIMLTKPKQVQAIVNGQVEYQKTETGQTLLFVKGSAGVDITYLLDDEILVEDGQHIKAGETLGSCKTDLYVTFEQNGKPFNPYPYLYYWQQK